MGIFTKAGKPKKTRLKGASRTTAQRRASNARKKSPYAKKK